MTPSSHHNSLYPAPAGRSSSLSSSSTTGTGTTPIPPPPSGAVASSDFVGSEQQAVTSLRQDLDVAQARLKHDADVIAELTSQLRRVQQSATEAATLKSQNQRLQALVEDLEKQLAAVAKELADTFAEAMEERQRYKAELAAAPPPDADAVKLASELREAHVTIAGLQAELTDNARYLKVTRDQLQEIATVNAQYELQIRRYDQERTMAIWSTGSDPLPTGDSEHKAQEPPSYNDDSTPVPPSPPSTAAGDAKQDDQSDADAEAQAASPDSDDSHAQDGDVSGGASTADVRHVVFEAPSAMTTAANEFLGLSKSERGRLTVPKITELLTALGAFYIAPKSAALQLVEELATAHAAKLVADHTKK